jgi:hypothetical protein
VQEATIHYGKPMRGSPTPLGATCIKEAVSPCSSDSARLIQLICPTSISPGTTYRVAVVIVQHCYEA